MNRKQNAVQWLIAQITSSNNSSDLSYPVKIQVSQEVIDEAMRILNHQLMEEWHEGYDEGVDCKVNSEEFDAQTKGVDYLIKELLFKSETTNKWVFMSDKNVDDIIDNARKKEMLSNEQSYKKGACDEKCLKNNSDNEKVI